MTTSEYLISLENVDTKKLLDTWTWLIDNDKSIIAITKVGDIILKNNSDELFFLDAGRGTLEKLSNNYKDFFENKLAKDKYDEMLLSNLVDNLTASGKHLKNNQVYSYTLLPILGGQYEVNNFFCLDLYEHCGLLGDIHFQIKDLPDGTKIEMRVE